MKQLEFARTKGWGGKRRGAGHKSKSGRRGHAKRTRVRPEHPLHVTMRPKPLEVSLRSRAAFTKFKACAARARAFGLHVNQFAVLGNHLHMIVEARDNTSLTRGMRSFGGALGKAVRALEGGRGAVFAGRYHAHVLKTPREYKNALKYVLLNHSHHAKLIAAPDRFSSGPLFRDWAQLLGTTRESLLEGLDERPRPETPHLSAPSSWLGRVGWRRARK